MSKIYPTKTPERYIVIDGVRHSIGIEKQYSDDGEIATADLLRTKKEGIFLQQHKEGNELQDNEIGHVIHFDNKDIALTFDDDIAPFGRFLDDNNNPVILTKNGASLSFELNGRIFTYTDSNDVLDDQFSMTEVVKLPDELVQTISGDDFMATLT